MKQLEERLDGIEEVLQIFIDKLNPIAAAISEMQSAPAVDYMPQFDELKTLLTELVEYHKDNKADHQKILQQLEQAKQVPQPITKQYRLLLFPEHNTEYYYKLTFGKLLPWAAGIIAVITLGSLGKQWVNAWQQVKEQEIETNISARAWDDLYKHANSRDKRILEQYWQRHVQGK
ncbi:hypothetical protein KHS38_20695 [Mucilaginibacter sp. Bleaf8]|uniref:hypothetical protein n=1 Tax=Mucilaginibacter sp. Bleaf8 TaxID=2834430 RepID=UPI001BD165B7|nr:hypothetical protein [Mucilaginibacter sp. Bleaf8]MBS7566836.1 hypothetical protein [Mucilaginibacter sp. Bleaf8]